MKKEKIFSEEKEFEINLKSIRFAYLFSQIALLAYCLIYTIIHSDFPVWPGLIFIVSAVIYVVTKIIIYFKEKNKIIKYNKEK